MSPKSITLVTYLKHTPTFEWWVVRCRSKFGHQKDTTLKEIGLRAPNLLTILGSAPSIIRAGDSLLATLMNQNNLRLVPIFLRIDPGFIRHIGRHANFNLANPISIR